MEKGLRIEEQPETLENAGESIGIVEKQKDIETIENIPEKTWFEIVIDAKQEFPEEVRLIIDKKMRGGPISGEEDSKFDKALYSWWENRFGINFARRNLTPMELQIRDKKITTREVKKYKLAAGKKEIMQSLNQSIKNLDEGELVEKFQDKERKIIYYDEEADSYYINTDDDAKKYLGIGDIIADYAWMIKYAPDNKMIEPAYRKISKRILTNEARRDLEMIYDKELMLNNRTPGIASRNISSIEERWKKQSQEKPDVGLVGQMAETLIREQLTRLSLNFDLDFIVMRASAEEDTEYKYDFKIRVYNRNRGVRLEEGLNPNVKIIKIGFQLKTSGVKDSEKITTRPGEKRNDLIDDLVILKINSKEISQVYDKWLNQDKPSGGPEQFLSRDLKIKLLKEVTKDLVEISDEEIERMFPVN